MCNSRITKVKELNGDHQRHAMLSQLHIVLGLQEVPWIEHNRIPLVSSEAKLIIAFRPRPLHLSSHWGQQQTVTLISPSYPDKL